MVDMFWRENDDSRPEFEVPAEVYDLVFSLRGSRLHIDHALALAEALQCRLKAETCRRVGVHGVHMAGSCNGWNRPEQSDAELPLSRRTRLVIRVHRDDHEEVAGLSRQTLQLGARQLRLGDSSIRKLSSLGCLYARAVCCDREQSESDFLAQVATSLRRLGIDVSKMICGRSGEIRKTDGSLFTRALLVADLSPEESVTLQQRGLGDEHLLGCGLFVPHKGIDAVYSMQE
ncbi:MAG: type I-MYXAN CRISPR-associated protein Cas6/Cmx6 [Gammaproteobacteria bacterium]|nr:type I-MYXAN CRISPR-associated protein Cas6/Cmx6 [Gammaproteobacteria bacterium]